MAEEGGRCLGEFNLDIPVPRKVKKKGCCNFSLNVWSYRNHACANSMLEHIILVFCPACCSFISLRATIMVRRLA